MFFLMRILIIGVSRSILANIQLWSEVCAFFYALLSLFCIVCIVIMFLLFGLSVFLLRFDVWPFVRSIYACTLVFRNCFLKLRFSFFSG